MQSAQRVTAVSMSSFADVLCPDLNLRPGCNAPKRRNMLVRIGPNAGPVYEIVSVEGPTAWMREPLTFRNEALVPLERLRVFNDFDRVTARAA